MSQEYRKNLFLLLLLAASVLAAGIGLRDPWPADEPRFALIARDMAESGNWLFPRVGGDLYPDKPPVFFWVVGAFYLLTGSLKLAFLLPGFLAGLGCVFMVADLGRRLWGERAGIWGAATLLALVQFPLVMKSGHIDALLCLLTTVSLYGLLRHLLLGPDWRWYTVGGLFAGVGVITKGVGFLPLLALLPYAIAARADWGVPKGDGSFWRWWLAPAALLVPILLWVFPVLAATSSGAEFEAYRDNILFHQTVNRYANSWGHLKPPWYLFTHAVPWLWLPATLVLPWLLPRWWGDLRNRRSEVLVIGGWIALVLLFFSLSPGKRSIYIFPAAPAFALLVGMHAEGLVDKARARIVLFAFSLLLTAGILGAGAYVSLQEDALAKWIDDPALGAAVGHALLACGLGMFLVVAACRVRRAAAGLAGALALFWAGFFLLVAPQIDRIRSGAFLMDAAGEIVPVTQQLAIVAWPEQLLLQWPRPMVHFGFRRPQETEFQDALAWLAQGGNRRLLLPEELASPCIDSAAVRFVAHAHREDWVLAAPGDLSGSCAVSAAGPVKSVLYVAPRRPRG